MSGVVGCFFRLLYFGPFLLENVRVKLELINVFIEKCAEI